MNHQNNENSCSDIKQSFAELDIKPTIQRVEIARVMLSQPQHLSAEQVLASVNQTGIHVSKATIYNTLNLFVEKGLVRQVIIDPAKVFYDSNTSHHYHFYNEDTGELSDFEPENMHFDPMPKLPVNTVKSGVDVILRLKNKS